MQSPQSEYRYAGHGSPGGSEPMTLGSPSSPQGNVNFLPPYLIGDSSQVSPSNMSIGNWSTPPAKQLVSFSSPHLSPIAPRRTLYQSPVLASNMGSGSNVSKSGPPVQGLFSTTTLPESHGLDFLKAEDNLRSLLPRFDVQNTSNIENQGHVSGILSPSKSFLNCSQNNSNFVSPAQIDPFYTQGEALTLNSQLDEMWVTIFGFPPASTNYVLQQFSQYGKIIDQKLATCGNWIHIRYQSKLQAKKALSKSGKVFGGSIMVGVKPCIEMDVMNNSGKENSMADLSGNFCQDNLDAGSLDTSKRSIGNIRRLAQVYKTPTSDLEVTPKGKTAAGSNSIVTKAIEYCMKW